MAKEKRATSSYLTAMSRAIIIICLLAWSQTVLATSMKSEIERLITIMSDRYGVPAHALMAIAHIESSSNPWTLRIGSEPFFFNNKSDTLNFIRQLKYRPWMLKVTEKKRAGSKNSQPNYYFFESEQAAIKQSRLLSKSYISNIEKLNPRHADIGLMQINWHWHGENTPSLSRLLDIDYNIAYSAYFLSKLIRRHGSLDVAIGYYHSNNKHRQLVYKERFWNAVRGNS